VVARKAGAEWYDFGDLQVIKMNDYQKKRFSSLIVQRLFNTVTGKKIGESLTMINPFTTTLLLLPPRLLTSMGNLRDHVGDHQPSLVLPSRRTRVIPGRQPPASCVVISWRRGLSSLSMIPKWRGNRCLSSSR